MAQFAVDTFSGTADTELPTYSANWVKASYSGVGVCKISSTGTRALGEGLNATYYHTGTPATADYTVKADIYIASVATDVFPGLVGRLLTSEETYYMARAARSADTALNWQLYKRVAGAFTQLGSNASQAISAGGSYEIKLSMVGTTIELYDEGGGSATIGVTDSAIAGAGKAGLRDNGTATSSTGYHIDNFSADDIGGGATAAAITAAAGVSTASALTGSATATATITQAAGTSTASMAGASIAAAAIAQSNGVATASTIAGGLTAVGAITQAAGVATESTMAASAVAVSAFSAAPGATTGETLAGSGLTAGASSITPASGASTASSLAGSSTSASAISPAAGAATASTISASVGVNIVAASMVPSAGVATASEFAASAVAATVAIASAGASSAQAMAATAQAVADFVAAAGVATAETMVDFDSSVPVLGSLVGSTRKVGMGRPASVSSIARTSRQPLIR